MIQGKAVRDAEAQTVTVLAFARRGPSAARRMLPSDLRMVRLAASRRPAVIEAPGTVILATPNPRGNRQIVRRVLGQRISRRLALASLAHRGADLVVLAGLVQGAEGLAAPVDLERKDAGSVAPAGLARLMVAAVPDAADLLTDHRAMRSPTRRIDFPLEIPRSTKHKRLGLNDASPRRFLHLVYHHFENCGLVGRNSLRPRYCLRLMSGIDL